MQPTMEWVPKHSVGDVVHHWKTGRQGTVTKNLGKRMEIQFDEVNAAGMPDGEKAERWKSAFIAGPCPAHEPQPAA